MRQQLRKGELRGASFGDADRRPGVLTSDIAAVAKAAGTRYPSSSDISVWLNATSTARAGVALLSVKSTSPAFMASITSAIR
jgi:hypothetical protein